MTRFFENVTLCVWCGQPAGDRALICDNCYSRMQIAAAAVSLIPPRRPPAPIPAMWGDHYTEPMPGLLPPNQEDKCSTSSPASSPAS